MNNLTDERSAHVVTQLVRSAVEEIVRESQVYNKTKNKGTLARLGQLGDAALENLALLDEAIAKLAAAKAAGDSIAVAAESITPLPFPEPTSRPTHIHIDNATIHIGK